MKQKLTLLLGLFFFLSASAQSKLNLPVSPFRNDVQKVVAEFPYRFAGLCGDVLAENPQTVEYASLVVVDKAEKCMVTKHSSGTKPVYSWQARMLTTDDFEEAARKYDWVFHQLKGMNVKYVADQYTLVGKYAEPTEGLKFTTSILTPDAPPGPWQKLKIEVALQFEFPEWKVLMNVYEKEREDDERGEITEQ